jgi:hypothetical protein
MSFDDGSYITTEFKMSLVRKDVNKILFYDLKEKPEEVDFFRLIDEVVTSVSVSKTGLELSVLFSNGYELVFLTEVGSIECGEIGIRGEGIIF